MNIYTITKKELSAKEKEFNKTAYGKKISMLSDFSIVLFIIFVFAVIAIKLCMYKCCCYGYCLKPDFSAIAIIGTILVALCIVSVQFYSKELRKYISSSEDKNE